MSPDVKAHDTPQLDSKQRQKIKILLANWRQEFESNMEKQFAEFKKEMREHYNEMRRKSAEEMRESNNRMEKMLQEMEARRNEREMEAKRNERRMQKSTEEVRETNVLVGSSEAQRNETDMQKSTEEEHKAERLVQEMDSEPQRNETSIQKSTEEVPAETKELAREMESEPQPSETDMQKSIDSEDVQERLMPEMDEQKNKISRLENLFKEHQEKRSQLEVDIDALKQSTYNIANWFVFGCTLRGISVLFFYSSESNSSALSDKFRSINLLDRVQANLAWAHPRYLLKGFEVEIEQEINPNIGTLCPFSSFLWAVVMEMRYM